MVHYDPFSYEIHDNPYPIYKHLRDEAPAYYNEEHGFWALSRYDDVRAALGDPETFCSGKGFLLEDIDDFALPMMIGMDPPDHTRVRATISRALTPKRVSALEPFIRGYARELLDRIAGKGEADMIADFAARLPMAVISSLLGVGEADRDELRTWADEMVHREDATKGVPEKGKQAAAKIYEYFERLLAERDTGQADDLLSLLLVAEARGEISHIELVGFCFLLIIAGNETTTKLIGNMTRQLGLHPDQRALLLDDPSLIAGAVEETLRCDSSTHMMARTLTRDVEKHGRTMRAGTKVAILLASANRDERKWKDPEVFDVRRDTSDHVAFGYGIHFCIGASLARLETRVAFEEILARISDFTVEESGLRRVHSGNVVGFSHVPISFTPAR